MHVHIKGVCVTFCPIKQSQIDLIERSEQLYSKRGVYSQPFRRYGRSKFHLTFFLHFHIYIAILKRPTEKNYVQQKFREPFSISYELLFDIISGVVLKL